MVQRPVSNYLNKCLFTVNIGSNDYINNYFMPQYYPTKKLFTPEQYADLLIAQYGAQLQVFALYMIKQWSLQEYNDMVKN